MDCHRVQELQSPLFDGELPLDLVKPVLAHLKQCSACRRSADDLRRVGEVVRESGAPAPVGLRARVLREARVAQERPQPLVVGLAAATPRIAAMLAGAACVMGLLSTLPREPVDSARGAHSAYHLLATESQADLELAGSFRSDFRVLQSRPEGRLMLDIAGGR